MGDRAVDSSVRALPALTVSGLIALRGGPKGAAPGLAPPLHGVAVEGLVTGLLVRGRRCTMATAGDGEGLGPRAAEPAEVCAGAGAAAGAAAGGGGAAAATLVRVFVTTLVLG